MAATLLAAILPAGMVVQDEPIDQRFSEKVSVAHVLVPVVVKGPGGPVEDLQRDDFELLVDGGVTPIDSFESGGNLPVTLFFLQDLSGSMALLGKLDSSRRILGHFLDRAENGDRFALVTFAGRDVDRSVLLTSDTDQLRRAARGWEGYGTTALHDAIAWLPRLIVDRASFRRAVLLVSDGLDNASSIEPAAARDRMRATEVPVYVIGLETGSPFQLTPDGSKRYRYADVMNLLAHLTGGRYYSVFDRTELDNACAAILEDLRHQYLLGFSAGGPGESKARSIEVRVKRKNVQVSFRQSYHGRRPLDRSP
jgi:VWFA-related protein